MTALRKAAQQALEALVRTYGYSMKREKAIEALKAALAEPEFPIGQASTDVPVTVYVVKKAHEP